MQLQHVTFAGVPFDSSDSVLPALPDDLIGLLRQINGFIMFGGGLQVRGVCEAPDWHSLVPVVAGPTALHTLYTALRQTDVPFAQDCVADQFILRERMVHKLEAETGELESMGLSLTGFLTAAQENPVEFLGMHPLLQYQNEGGALQPGQVLHAYPPFCTKEAANGVSLRAVPVSEAIAHLGQLSRQLAALGTGAQFEIKVKRGDG